jgi:hypothetical protein
MSVSVSIPQTVQIRRNRFVGVIAGVAALAAAATWAVLALGLDTGGQAQRAASAQPTVISLPIPSVPIDLSKVPTAEHGRRIHSVMDLTPGDVAGGGVWGYGLPTVDSGPTTAEVLAAMSPQTRRYTERLMGLTFSELAAGAGGTP